MTIGFILCIAYVIFAYGFFVGKLNDKKFWKKFHKNTADYGI